MAIADDISVATNGDIRYTGTTNNYTVIEFHRFLQGLADNASSSGDDLLDITDDTPSERSTDNIITLYQPYNIDDTLAQHLYDGSIIQKNGDEIYDGIINFGVQGIHIEIMQNGQLITPNFWTTGINADSNAGISHGFMVKVRTNGQDIDGRRLIGLAREFGNSYTEFSINGTSRGNNVLALTHSTDLNNQTPESTVSTWDTITNLNEGYVGIDVDNNGVDEYYYSKWDKDTYTINDFYERMKWLTRRGSTETLYGLNGDIFRGITHEIDIDTTTGTFNSYEPISWGGGTGQMLAINDVTAGTKMWIQLLTGVPPIDEEVITGGTSGATAVVNVNVIERPIATSFVGASTGSALIGSYGLALEATDLSANDKVFDLTNTQMTPPNYVTFTVAGLVSGEDRVLVTDELNGGVNESQFTLNGGTTSGDTSVVVNEVIPSDTPTSATIRVFDGSVFVRVAYTGWNGSTFTGCTDVPTASDGANAYLSYIDTLAGADTESYTCVYNTDRDLFIRVRDGGASPIKTFQTTGTLGAGGGSTTAIRTSDE
jgi:hypothetical protein